MAWIMNNKKKLIVLVAALAGVYVGVMNFIGGNQGEDTATKIEQKLKDTAAGMPDDPVK